MVWLARQETGTGEIGLGAVRQVMPWQGQWIAGEGRSDPWGADQDRSDAVAPARREIGCEAGSRSKCAPARMRRSLSP